MSTDKKLIFLDIDGTLVQPGENTPPESAVQAIKAAQAKGNKVFLCTGRNLDMLKPLLRFGFDGMVASSGGYVTVGDEVIYDNPMTVEDTKLALAVLHENGVFCTVEAVDGSFGDENLGEFLSGQAEGNSEIERWRKALSENLNIRPMGQYDWRPVYKVVIMCLKMEQLDAAKLLLSDRYDFVVQDVPERPAAVVGQRAETLDKPGVHRRVGVDGLIGKTCRLDGAEPKRLGTGRNERLLVLLKPVLLKRLTREPFELSAEPAASEIVALER